MAVGNLFDWQILSKELTTEQFHILILCSLLGRGPEFCVPIRASVWAIRVYHFSPRRPMFLKLFFGYSMFSILSAACVSHLLFGDLVSQSLCLDQREKERERERGRKRARAREGEGEEEREIERERERERFDVHLRMSECDRDTERMYCGLRCAHYLL